MLALPFLEAIRPRTAHAMPSGAPKRLLLVKHRQGTVMEKWVPTGSETDWELSEILGPLSGFEDRMVVVSGLDNRVPQYNSAGDGHENADATVLTGALFEDQGASVLTAGGPSIEQVIAERISTDTSYARVDLGIGGGTGGSGLVTAREMFYGAADPVDVINNPELAQARLFGDASLSAEEIEALSERRASVLDGVLDEFASLRARLGSEDQARLDAHAEKVRELEQRFALGGAGCGRPELGLPSGFDYGEDEDVVADGMIELMVAALACDLTRVGTLLFASSEDPTFPWLDLDGEPVVDTAKYNNWHFMVHDGRDEPGLAVGIGWYTQVVADLLAAMDATLDADGDNLLDTTLVLWCSEFGDGILHGLNKLPFVLFGACGEGVTTGRHIDLLSGTPDDYQRQGDYTHQQLLTSILHAFGGEDESFGHTASDLPNGPLTML